MKQIISLITTAALLLSLFGCGRQRSLDTAAVLTDSGELVFAAAAEEFIETFNSVYRSSHGKDYLKPLSGWRHDRLEPVPHFLQAADRYWFTGDGAVWSLCALSIYTPAESHRIRELAVEFDDHSYSDELYELYSDLCICAVMTFFPELSKADAEALFKRLFIVGSEAITKTSYFDSTNPYLLYYNQSVGVYPYFSYGEMMQICFVPVTPEYIGELRSSGTAVFEIPAN